MIRYPGIQIELSGFESNASLCAEEKYLEPLRRTYHKIRHSYPKFHASTELTWLPKIWTTLQMKKVLFPL